MHLGHQFVSVKLKDGRYFEHAVASEGCIIQVKSHRDISFSEADVEWVEEVTSCGILGVASKNEPPERVTAL